MVLQNPVKASFFRAVSGFYEGFGLLPRVTRRLWYSRTQMKDGAGAVSRLQARARVPCLLFSPESSLGVLGLWVLDSGFRISDLRFKASGLGL